MVYVPCLTGSVLVSNFQWFMYSTAGDPMFDW